MIHFCVYLEERKFEARMRKRRAAFVLSPGLFFSPRNIKTQFEGNFFNRRLLKFPENCVLMFRGQRKKAWAKYKSWPSFLKICWRFFELSNRSMIMFFSKYNRLSVSAFKIFCWKISLRLWVRRSCGEKQEAAAAVELTSLFVLVSNALYTEHTSLSNKKECHR